MSKKKKIEETDHKCRECVHAHSPYNVGYDGDFILSKCAKSKHSVLLNGNVCGEFRKLK